MPDQSDLTARVEQSLKSQKVDARMAHEFHALMAGIPVPDLKQSEVCFLASVSGENVELKGIIGRTGTIYTMRVPYSDLPDLISNPDVRRIELSQPGGTY